MRRKGKFLPPAGGYSTLRSCALTLSGNRTFAGVTGLLLDQVLGPVTDVLGRGGTWTHRGHQVTMETEVGVTCLRAEGHQRGSRGWGARKDLCQSLGGSAEWMPHLGLAAPGCAGVTGTPLSYLARQPWAPARRPSGRFGCVLTRGEFASDVKEQLQRGLPHSHTLPRFQHTAPWLLVHHRSLQLPRVRSALLSSTRNPNPDAVTPSPPPRSPGPPAVFPCLSHSRPG